MTRTAGLRLAAFVVTILVAGSVIIGRDHSDGVTRARRIAQQDTRFGNGPKAGTAFADISRLLLDDARSCAHRYGSSDPRCQARSSAAAFTTVSAFTLVGCTQPGVFRARRAVLDELAGIALVDRRRGVAPPPAVPPLLTC